MVKFRKLTPSALYWFNRCSQTCISCSSRSFLSTGGPTRHKLGHCCHHFQHIAADIQLHTQFSGHRPPICADELIEMLFILWCDSCAWLSTTQLAFHITVSTAATLHPLHHCAHIHCLVSISVQQASVSVNGYHFFSMEEFDSTPLPPPHFHIICHLSHSNKM